MTRRRYELQVRHKSYGWVTAGTWPARDEAQGRQSLSELLKPFGSSRTYRLVELIPREIARGRSKKEKDNAD